MTRQVAKGQLTVVDYVYLADKTTGAALTGLDVTTIDMQFTRELTAPSAKVDGIVGTGGLTTHVDNKIVEVDATDQPGLHMVCWVDTPFATGVNRVVCTVHVPGVSAPAHREFELHDRPTVGVAFADVPMLMVLKTDHATPAGGVTPTLTVSKNGGAFGAKDAGTTVAEIGSTGTFQVDLDGADVVKRTLLKLTETTADDSFLTLIAEGE